jgi:hypothetical protein
MIATKSIGDCHKPIVIKASRPWVRRVISCLLPLLNPCARCRTHETGPGCKAIAWHYRHGSRIAVRALDFPCRSGSHLLTAATSSRSGIAPGPLRPTDDEVSAFEIGGRRDQDDAGRREELVQPAMRMYSGCRDLSRLQRNIRSQTLVCRSARAPGRSSFLRRWAYIQFFSAAMTML